MRVGDILFAKRNAYLRRVAIAPHDGFFSAHGMVLRAREEAVLPEFLPFLMMSDKFMNRAVEISVGSLSPTSTGRPLSRRSSTYRRSTSSDESLRCYGLLMQSWQPCVIVELPPMSSESRSCATRLVPCPKTVFGSARYGNSWRQMLLSRHRMEITVSCIQSPKTMLRTASHSSWRMTFGMVACASIPARGFQRYQARRLRIGFARPGDVLLTHKGTIGLAAVVPPEAAEFVMLTPQVTYYRVKDSGRLRGDFLLAVFTSEQFQSALRLRAKQSTRDYIGILAQRELPVVVPDPDEQDRIVRKLHQVDIAVTELKKHIAEVSALMATLTNTLC